MSSSQLLECNIIVVKLLYYVIVVAYLFVLFFGFCGFCMTCTATVVAAASDKAIIDAKTDGTKDLINRPGQGVHSTVL